MLGLHSCFPHKELQNQVGQSTPHRTHSKARVGLPLLLACEASADNGQDRVVSNVITLSHLVSGAVFTVYEVGQDTVNACVELNT